nr:PAS domain S-box protein [Methylorubrum extorquens]
MLLTVVPGRSGIGSIGLAIASIALIAVAPYAAPALATALGGVSVTAVEAGPVIGGVALGYAGAEMLGKSPRLLQGRGTNPQLTRLIARRLRAEGRFHGVLENYRKSGEAYLCEIDVRPILGQNEVPLAFLAFEREVVRRRGRPAGDPAGRYRPVEMEASLLEQPCSGPAPFT